jgi:hypothetical protein
MTTLPTSGMQVLRGHAHAIKRLGKIMPSVVVIG